MEHTLLKETIDNNEVTAWRYNELTCTEYRNRQIK